jgi:hypothetical protein
VREGSNEEIDREVTTTKPRKSQKWKVTINEQQEELERDRAIKGLAW